jgi:valyl-tRNA synthetase
MIFSGIEQMNKIPFRYVFIHGLVRDSQGRKMSKSLGNGIDPLDIIEKYGADALRFTLATGNSPGNDMRFYLERVESSRNFANKLWNASRFVHMNLDLDTLSLPDNSELRSEDKWLLTAFNKLVSEVTANIDKYELGIALAKVYDFIWDIFCDWYIELVKPRLSNKEDPSNKAAQQVISWTLSETLKLLHPFMPFITEEIWLSLPHDGESIMISKWPEVDSSRTFEEESAEFEKIISAIRAIRLRRTEMNVPPSRKTKLYVVSESSKLFEASSAFLEKLAGVSQVEAVEEYTDSDSVAIITDSASLYIPMADMVDFDKELERLEKELAKAEKEIAVFEKKLSNADFVSRAPAQVVEGERAKLEKYRAQRESTAQEIEKIRARLKK